MCIKPTTAIAYIQLHPKWKNHLTAIVKALEGYPVQEHIKWGATCYTLDGKIIIGLAAFKNHCAIWFHQGSLLADPENILVNAQPGKTKMLRQVRFRESELSISATTRPIPGTKNRLGTIWWRR